MRETVKRRGSIVMIIAGLVSGLFWNTASPAAAYYEALSAAYWGFEAPQGADAWNLDQVVQVRQKAPSTFWALYWSFVGGPDGGYVGLQTDGYRFDGTKGQLAIFSLWNANGSRNAGGKCAAFGNEGVGLSCRGAFPINTRVLYRLRVQRLGVDSQGQWWGAWVYDPSTSRNYHIGDLRVPVASHSQINLANVSNFTEYFGPTVACDKVPQSTALYTQPAANTRPGNVYDYYSRYGSFLKGTCVRASIAQVSGTWTGVVLRSGG
jgi:hypothetical protein